MSFSFYKKCSNAKFMNNLCFTLVSKEDSIIIKNNKSEKELKLHQNDENNLNKIENLVYKTFYKNLILIKNSIDWIFDNTEEKYHKYINIKINCYSIYTENALKEWMYDWFSERSERAQETYIASNNLVYMGDLKNVYDKFKKCKITVN